MRVLMIITARQIGGAEVYAQHLVRDLAAQCCFTVALAAHPALDAFAADLQHCAEVVRLPFDDARQTVSTVRALRRLAVRHDLMHINSNHPASRWGVLLAAALTGCGVPIICVEQRVTPVSDVRVPRALGWAMPTLFGWSRRSAACVIAVSQQNSQMLVEYYGLPASKIRVVHNGADLEMCRAPHPSGSTLRAELGLGANQPVILVLARVTPNKGQQFLVRAAPGILERFPDAHFVFAGSLEDRGLLDREITQLDLANKVALLGFRTDAANLLRGADVFVLPSLAEGFALSIVEALAAGLPVVASRVGGAPEIIADGVNGRLVPPADAAALAAAVSDLLALDDAARARLKQAALDTARRFSSEETARQTFDIYTEMAAGQHAHSH